MVLMGFWASAIIFTTAISILVIIASALLEYHSLCDLIWVNACLIVQVPTAKSQLQ